MKKLLRNKRMFLTLVAGLLVFVAVLGAGTFAWFTGHDTITVQGDIVTATVGVKAEDLTFSVLDFYPATTKSLNFQKDFEATFGGPKADFEYAMWEFKGWKLAVSAFGPPYAYEEFDNDNVPVPPRPTLEVSMVKNSFSPGSLLPQVINVTPGCLINAEYSFNVKDSTIPVYFRVQAASLQDLIDGKQLEYGELLTLNIAGIPTDTTAPFTIVAELEGNPIPVAPYTAHLKLVDGWYYCDLPLSPVYAWQVDVKHEIYVYGEANGNDLQNTTITFANTDGDAELEVEVIQATNNAVYLADEWKDAAGTWGAAGPDDPFFIEYVDTNAFGLYDVYKGIL